MNIYEIQPDGRWKLRFDHHTIADFALCEELFHLKHLPNKDGKVLRGRGRMGFDAAFGVWWAAVLEDFYAHVEEYQHDPARCFDQLISKQTFIGQAVGRWAKSDMDSYALTAPGPYNKVAGGFVGIEREGRMLKFPAGVLALTSSYWDYQQQMQDIKNWKIIAVETTFGISSDVIIAEDDSVIVAYVGRPDLVVYDQSKKQIVPVDTKTVGDIDEAFRSNWKPSAQMCGYIVATQELCNQLGLDTEINSVIINGCARNAPAKNPRSGIVRPRFERLRVSFSTDELTEWRQDMLRKGRRMRECIENNQWTWNQGACHHQHGPYKPCEYRELHRLAPSERLLAIQSHYTMAAPWEPNK